MTTATSSAEQLTNTTATEQEEQLQLIENEEKSDDNNSKFVGRASIAALDLHQHQLQPAEDEKDADLPPKGVLFRAHSLDSGKEKIVSVPTMEEMKLISSEVNGAAIKEEVVVPPRDVLMKMPFYSTPLTVEATNNAFRDFVVRLNEMGFTQQAEAALVATNAESVESAVEFIMNNPDALYHRFASNTQEEEEQDEEQGQLHANIDGGLCSICGLGQFEHIIDEDGNKIVQKDEDEEEKQKEQETENLLESAINEKVRSIANHEEEAQHSEKIELQIASEHEEKEKEKEQEAEKKETEKKQEAEEEEYTGPGELCMVCFDKKPFDQFYGASCGHNYCKSCLETHYKIKTKDGDVLKVSCIDPKCDRMIEEDEILSFLVDEELRAKFKRFRENKLAMLNPNVRFCCKPNCDGTMVGSQLKRKLTCPLCGTAVCFNCNQPWHGLFVGCNQNVDIGYAKWALNKDVNKCPKCRMAIEKIDGCNHMTCSSCSYEFCWICKGPYNDHHFEWWNIFGCPGAQYTPRFCRCPFCFPRWLNRILIILCFLSIVIPIVIIAAIFWILIICFIFCIRCDFKVPDPCDCF